MKKIVLSRGLVATVDDCDFETLNQFKWSALKHGNDWYAVRADKNNKMIYMHRHILNAEHGQRVDHKQNGGLDNRRANLRFCTQSQNLQNTRPRQNTSSKYKGVSWNKHANKWIASIRINGKSKHLGLFVSELNAAKAYDRNARILFGSFAKTNF